MPPEGGLAKVDARGGLTTGCRMSRRCEDRALTGPQPRGDQGEFGLDTIQSHLQDLARQHLIGGDKNRPELWQVRRNCGARRLSFMCGVDPHHVAIRIDPDE